MESTTCTAIHRNSRPSGQRELIPDGFFIFRLWPSRIFSSVKRRCLPMKNRWLIALSAIGIHICIGSVYAWSVLTKPIMQAMGFTLKETTWTFSIAILFLGLSAGFLGDYVEKYARVKAASPRPASLVWVCSVQRWHCISTVCRSYIFFTALSAVSVLGPVISPLFRRWSNGFPTTAALPPVLLSWVSVLPA